MLSGGKVLGHTFSLSGVIQLPGSSRGRREVGEARTPGRCAVGEARTPGRCPENHGAPQRQRRRVRVAAWAAAASCWARGALEVGTL